MASNTLSQNINQVITDLSNIKTSLIGKGQSIPVGTPVSSYSGIIDSLQIGTNASAEFNMHFGDTAPEDLTKLWVKTSLPPNIIINTDISTVLNEATLVNPVATADSVICSGRNLSAERIDEKVYLFGGYDESPEILIYDLITCLTTSTGVNMPTDRIYQHATGRIDNEIYLIGGRNSSGVTNKIYCFDVIANTLSDIGLTVTLNKGYGYHGFGYAAVGTKIYFFGGYQTTSSSSIVDTAFCFDMETRVFSDITDWPYGDSALMSCVVIGTDIFICGGYGTTSTKIVKYDTLTGAYLTVATMPASIIYCQAVSIGTDIYVFYEYGIYKFDSVTSEVTTITTASVQRYRQGFMLSYGSDVFSFGGNYLTNQVLKMACDIELEQNHLQIASLRSGQRIELFNQNGIELKMPVSDVFKGDSNNLAQKVEAYYYDNDQWNLI
ncbi:kelch repeat-containing protein [Eubacteriaceae bacterium ES3]|nr:kelch repeat-containing protein [Eubacteriaceae bacterium ES3]